MDQNHTNIRYYIFKELLKHRELIEKQDSKKISDFAIPVFSGISATLMSNEIAKILFVKGFVQILLFYLVIPTFIYIFLYCISSYIIKLYEKALYYFGNQTEKETLDKIKVCEYKFNYEITNLIYISYQFATNKSDDIIVHEYDLFEAVFYLHKSLIKLQKSLPYIYSTKELDNRFLFFINMMKETIIKLYHDKDYAKIQNDVISMTTLYNDVVDSINKKHKTSIQPMEL